MATVMATRLLIVFVTVTLLVIGTGVTRAQGPSIQYGDAVPAEVKQIYERGLDYLANEQQQDGSWSGGQQGSGITGMCLMAFLAHGEDPNFGRYQLVIQRAVRNIIESQDAKSGYISGSMYHHGFATLALAEAYGAVDDSLLWDGGDASRQRSIGEALELAVRRAVTSQNNEGGWRYSPESNDADTSVTGAILMGLLAARNAGIEVPDQVIDKSLLYYQSMTTSGGTVGYSGAGSHGDSMNRSAIATLVMAIGKRRDWEKYQAASHYIGSNLTHQEQGYPFYFRYYMAQALFQSDFDAWTKWKRENTAVLRNLQREDGHFDAGHGPAYGTAMSLLSLALDYRYLPIYER
ncbi:MAG: squalene--hopene cyclase [Planctomycetaceae bacterium]